MTTRNPRLAEVVASLSIATDLGLGLPEDHVLRQTLIAHRIGRLVGFDAEQLTATYYVSMLAWVGCVADSHELSRAFGDDLRVRRESYLVEKTGIEMMRFLLGQMVRGRPPLEGVAVIGRALAGGMSDATDSFVTHCQTTGDIADRLNLSPTVARSLQQTFERWDGRGTPSGLVGEAIDPVVRVVQIADDAEVMHRTEGFDTAAAMLARRRGTEFDPHLVDLVLGHPADVFAGLDDCWNEVIALAGDLESPLSPAQFDAALVVFGDYADLKSPWFLGHSAAVATLAKQAATVAGLPADDARRIRNAALVAHLGRTGVSTGIWDKSTPLSPADWERIRTVPYLTERILHRQPALAELGVLAGQIHERMDGSGYPRGLRGVALSIPARILAVAEWYQTLGEARPHRAAVPASQRAAMLAQQVKEGVFDESAARAVLTAAGHRVPRRTSAVAGLTDRELQVLELLVRGASNRDIADRLQISRRTVGSHVEHIYAKTGVSTRGAAAMFAMRHGLVDAGG